MSKKEIKSFSHKKKNCMNSIKKETTWFCNPLGHNKQIYLITPSNSINPISYDSSHFLNKNTRENMCISQRKLWKSLHAISANPSLPIHGTVIN